MKLRILLAAVALLVAFAGSAAAKFATVSLTIDGPGMRSPAVIDNVADADELYVATLDDYRQVAVKPPRTTGPAYTLEYRFAVADSDGHSEQTIRQTLYPFAAGGPVVFTPPGQGIDWSFDPVRFRAGWFAVPLDAVQHLQAEGVPHTRPDTHAARPALARVDPSPSRWPWSLALSLGLAAGAAAVLLKRARSRRTGGRGTAST